MSKELLALLALAVLVEALTENTMWLVPQRWHAVGDFPVARWLALAWSLIVAWSVSADLFAALGLPAVQPAVNVIVSAVVLARGANGLHDLLAKIEPQ